MPFPSSERVVFEENPIKEVICQLQFPTILEIGSESPAGFQNKVRHGYPIYNREDALQNLPQEIASLVGQLRLPLPAQLQSPTHKFATSDESRFISLNPAFVAVTDKNYRRWEQLSEQIKAAQLALEETYKPAFYTRIGLRYQDVIDKVDLGLDEPWHALINPSLIGLLGEQHVQDEVRDIRTVSLVEFKEVRGGFIQLTHGLKTLAQGDRQVYVIDADFFTRERSELDHVHAILDEFNRGAGNLFRWAATPRLQRALKPLPIK